MTIIDLPTVPTSTPEERVERLNAAGAAWAERVAADPSSAQLTSRVRGVGEGSVASRIAAGKHSFLVDEPAALAGDNVGPSPVEVALGALISCQVVVYRLYAQTLGIVIDDITVDAEGDLDARRLFGFEESVRAGFSDVRLTVSISGPETSERYEELRAAVDEHCPVLDIFANATPVTSTVRKV